MKSYLTVGGLLLLGAVLWFLLRPTATVTFRVITDSGKPIEGAQVSMSTFPRWQPGEGFGRDISVRSIGKTNSTGMVTLKLRSSRGGINYNVENKTGQYPTHPGTFRFVHQNLLWWKPYNPTIDVIVKPILNPTPVFASHQTFKIPKLGEPLGFDLMMNDWVAPYGNGEVADFIIVFCSNFTGSQGSPFESSLVLTFPNADDGIQGIRVPLESASRLHLPRFAPENGYASKLELARGRPVNSVYIVPQPHEDQNYFFRVRSQTNEGKMVSALYGKIRGNIYFDEQGSLSFAYYLNPEPLSRNMEFDMARNRIFPRLPNTGKLIEP